MFGPVWGRDDQRTSQSMPVFPDVVPCHHLTIRTWTPDDVAALRTAIEQSAELLRPWMSFMSDEPMADSDRTTQIDDWERQRRRGGDAFYGMFSSETVIGGCTLHRRAGPDTVGLGYWLHIDHIGHGHARAAAAYLTTVALSLPGVTRVEIHHDAANSASRRIPQSLGFHYDGERPERPVALNEIGVDVAWSTTSTTWSGPPD